MNESVPDGMPELLVSRERYVVSLRVVKAVGLGTEEDPLVPAGGRESIVSFDGKGWEMDLLRLRSVVTQMGVDFTNTLMQKGWTDRD